MIPESHKIENEKLVADGCVDLFQVVLKNNTNLYLKNNNTVNWQGKSWQGIPLSFEGYSSSSTEELSRPSLSIANPNGAFSTYIRDGLLNRAVLYRYRVLYKDILEDNNVYQKQTWIVWSTPSLTNKYIQFELRTTLDGPNFVVPARQYLPPEFPCVKL